MQRDRAHIELWHSLFRTQQREHNAEVERLRGQIAGLEQELHDRPEKEVIRYIGLEELQEATAEKQRAFRSRENAWQALCMIRLKHREGEPGRCRCGERLDRCEIAQIVDRYPGLIKWEKEQWERRRNNLPHELPDGHPGILDPNWRP